MTGKFTISLSYEASDALLIAILRDSVRGYAKEKHHPDDQEYAKQYIASANFVIEHFGGEPTSNSEPNRRKRDQQ